MEMHRTQALNSASTQLDRLDDSEETARIAQAIGGNTEAIDWLITRYRSRVVRLAYHILRQSAEAEDAAQDAFIRAFRSLHKFNNHSPFYTWLYRIVVHVCLDKRRLKRWECETDVEQIREVECRVASPYSDTELRITVEALLEKLSPTMRAMIVLRELDGLEYAEIAHVLQIPVGRVRWRLHTARQQFQALWLEAQQETDNV